MGGQPAARGGGRFARPAPTRGWARHGQQARRGGRSLVARVEHGQREHARAEPAHGVTGTLPGEAPF